MNGITDPAEAITGVLSRACADGADPTWTAHAILAALKRLGWLEPDLDTDPEDV